LEGEKDPFPANPKTAEILLGRVRGGNFSASNKTRISLTSFGMIEGEEIPRKIGSG
jgi:hypothetical protein